MKRLFTLLAAVVVAATSLSAQQFDNYFTNRTLRNDLIFAGDCKAQQVTLRQLLSWSGWAGRRVNLDQVALEGNGQLTMTDSATGAVIYRTSFSSLFQEWLTTPEATTTHKAYEFTILVPMPIAPADVRVTLLNERREQTALLDYHIDPTDILIRNTDSQATTPHKVIYQSGPAEEKIDVAIVAEGYTAGEMDTFLADAQATVDALLSYEPFKSQADKFNFVAVESASVDSNVSIPREGIWRDTAVGSHFDTFYGARYLTTSQVFDLYDLLNGIDYEHLIILANTDTYGGGGIYNSYTLTTAHHPLFKPVVVHEFGHSFGGLADEYFYENDPLSPGLYLPGIEPWEQNLTTLANFESKWADMLPEGTAIPTEVTPERTKNFTVGVYEGGGYQFKGVYRPADICRMRDNVATQFCPVCQRALARMIEFYTTER